jgi:hypothetical protein
MLADRIEGKWIDAFCEVFARCAVKPGDTAAILSETQSRALNVHLAELALLRLSARPFHVAVPTPKNRHPVPVRSTGASEAIGGLAPVVAALGQSGFVVDCTLEGVMHAPETPAILKAGARILVISNEHPETLERMAPDGRARAPRARRRKNAARRKANAGDLRGRQRSVHRPYGRGDGRGLGAGPIVPAPSPIGRAGSWSPSPRPAPWTGSWCSTRATSILPSSAIWLRPFA